MGDLGHVRRTTCAMRGVSLVMFDIVVPPKACQAAKYTSAKVESKETRVSEELKDRRSHEVECECVCEDVHHPLM